MLESEVMSMVSRLPDPERLLADFIYHGHMEKRCFMDHTIHDARHLQSIKELELVKEMQMKEVRSPNAGRRRNPGIPPFSSKSNPPGLEVRFPGLRIQISRKFSPKSLKFWR